MQVPRGSEELSCPFWQKPMSECCHKCPMWTQVRGKDPQTGQDLADEWACAIALLPMLSIESSRTSLRVSASADKIATEVADLHESVKQANVLNSTILLDERVNGRGMLITQNDEDK